MLAKYMSSLTRHDFPVVLSITDTTSDAKAQTIIRRNYVQANSRHHADDIYMRAREIFYRARRQSAVRAASIF